MRLALDLMPERVAPSSILVDDWNLLSPPVPVTGQSRPPCPTASVQALAGSAPSHWPPIALRPTEANGVAPSFGLFPLSLAEPQYDQSVGTWQAWQTPPIAVANPDPIRNTRSTNGLGPPENLSLTPSPRIDGKTVAFEATPAAASIQFTWPPFRFVRPASAKEQAEAQQATIGGNVTLETATGSDVGGPLITIAPVPTTTPLTPTTPLFRVSIVGTTAEAVAVPYVLQAHSAVGTQGTRGTFTQPGTITADATLAATSPQVVTLTLPMQHMTATHFAVPVPQISDPVLFEAHRLARSPEAFSTLVKRHEAAVTRLCQQIVRNRADAEDVRQFVFLELSRFQNRFPVSLTGWLHTVSRNASLTFLRGRRRRLHYEAACAKSPSDNASTVMPFDDELSTAIGQLPPELGEAVRLRYLDGYSQHEAALIAGCPRGTLSRRAAYGLRALRMLLTPAEEHPT